MMSDLVLVALAPPLLVGGIWLIASGSLVVGIAVTWAGLALTFPGLFAVGQLVKRARERRGHG